MNGSLGTFWFVNAGFLFRFARDAHNRIAKKNPPEREPQKSEAIIAIVFSAFALEAFINEAAHLAAQPPPPAFPPYQETVTAFASRVAEASGRMSVLRKFSLVRQIFTGHPYDENTSPFRGFKLLVSLRNALAHVRGLETVEITFGGEALSEPPGAIDELRGMNILGEIVPPASWTELIQTLATARWSCHTASRMVHSLVAAIQDDNFRTLLDHYYSEDFRPV